MRGFICRAPAIALAGARGGASLPYTMTFVGLMFGSIVMGRLTDRFGIVLPVLLGALALGGGDAAASFAPGLTAFALVSGLIIGLVGFAAATPTSWDATASRAAAWRGEPARPKPAPTTPSSRAAPRSPSRLTSPKCPLSIKKPAAARQCPCVGRSLNWQGQP